MLELEKDILVGTKVRLRKSHPCGKENRVFLVYYIGNRVELQCIVCSHRFFLDREVFSKNFVEVVE